ncbi:TPA: ABC transporter ATP-binding protein [Candidatus Pacearchaeota archaeon]|jgi:putative ABC transport system ATP-binding protein|nr:ABC transporter ATP-binding protein [Candidatus Pacearchaeota archaeon]
MSEIIKLEKVEKHFKMGESVVKAVDGIDVKIERGDFVAIVGPSGSGKSTAMNLVGSLDSPTKGKIFLDKKNISDFDESNLAQLRGKKIGFIFQSFNLIQNLTAKENIMIPMIFQGLSKSKRIEKAEKLLKEVGLGERMDSYPNKMSGGEQQRVAIARALANDPEVILADEPTGNLDTKTGEMVMKFLDDLNRKGRTIVMVTHDLDLVKKHARTVFWIKDGKVEKITKNIKGKK